MRDAFGGVFMMRLMLAFIVIFVAFSAISLNYAKAFRVKNQIIDVVEQTEIQDINDISSQFNRIKAITNNADYNVNCNNEFITNDAGQNIGICYNGIVISIDKKRSNNEYIYYNVITYGGWNLGVLNMLLALSGDSQDSQEPMRGAWAISGEAKVRNYTVNNAPFDEHKNGDRCYDGKWIRIDKCQPVSVVGAQCKLKDGTLVLRNKLTIGEGCVFSNAPYDPSLKGKRCHKETLTPIYINGCQAENIPGARCKVVSGYDKEYILRTYLTGASKCPD